MDKKQDFNQQEENGAGRTANAEPKTGEKQKASGDRADISNVDQQEGDMHHGETGGSGHFSSGSNNGQNNRDE